MSNSIKLQGNKIRIKQLNNDGEFCSSNRTRYVISIPQDFVRQPTQFELACLQVNKKSPKEELLGRTNGHLLFNRQNAVKKPFYIATMCVIGSMANLFSPHEAINVDKIVKAVSERDGFWVEAIEHFNSLFETDSNAYLRVSARNPSGKLVAACAMSGLHIVCDLIKESRNLTLAGKYFEAAKIENMLESMGLLNLHAYLLLSSPDHPRYQALSDAMDDYENKYELCVGDNGEWILVSAREIKKISFSHNVNYATVPSNDGYIIVANHEADLNTADTPAPTNIGDEEHQAEAEHHQEDQQAEVEQKTTTKLNVAQNAYSTQRTRRTPPGLTDGEDKLGGTGFNPKKPSNIEEMPIDFGEFF